VIHEVHVKSNAGFPLKMRWKELVNEEEVVISYLMTLRKEMMVES